MPDLRSSQRDFIDAHRERALHDTDPSDWLTLPQAACELGISVSTARRMIRKGRLRNRIVPRRGGFAYLVYAPGSKHAQLLADCHHDDAAVPIDRAETGLAAARIRTLEDQIDNLSAALSRALRAEQASVPSLMPQANETLAGPYAQYRSPPARKRRWWSF